MNTTWSIKENSTGNLKVTVDKEAWKDAQMKAFNKLAREIEVPGFRKGQVPKELATKHISEQKILVEAAQNHANEAYVSGLSEHQLDPIVQPTMDIESLTVDEIVYNFTVTCKPEVTLGAYKGVEVEPIVVKVTASDVKEQLEHLREDYAELVVKDTEAIKKGDTAVIDFEGFKDGIAFEGGKGENYPLEIGSNSFIPGFEEQLIGLKTGDEKDLDITFPESYQVAELAGQPVVFKVKVNEVKEKVLPALDDDFAKEVNESGVETLKELKAKVKADILDQRQKKAAEDENDLVLNKVVDAATVAIPDVMIDEEVEMIYRELQQRLSQQGLSLDMYKQILGQNDEQIKEQMREEAQKRVKVRLVLEKVAQEENLQSNDEDVENEYSSIADQYGLDVARVKELASTEAIAYDIRIRKAFDFIKAARI